MELIGYFACALIGISLGLIGAGGSILTVPVLVFLFQMPPVLATSYSLFVVGITSSFTAMGKYRKGDVLVNIALAFGLVSMVVVTGIRHYVIPATVKFFDGIGSSAITYDMLCMLLFAGLMVLAAVLMIRKRSMPPAEETTDAKKLIKILPYAVVVGIITGFLGAGGGFLLIPVMTLLLGMCVRKAVGTSLVVVAINSLSGFINDLSRVPINWQFLSVITIIALIGSISGAVVAERINSKRLKAYFGWFVLFLGIMIIARECFVLLNFR